MIFFARLWSMRKAMLFSYTGRLVTNQQKPQFKVFALFPCRLVLYLYTCAVENHEISGYMYQKLELCAQSEDNQNLVLFCKHRQAPMRFRGILRKKSRSVILNFIRTTRNVRPVGRANMRANLKFISHVLFPLLIIFLVRLCHVF